MFVEIKNKLLYVKSPHWIQKFIILFALGAIISVIDANGHENGLTKGLAVLPNYIYWSILSLFIINIKYSLNFNVIGKYIANGLIMSLIYYHISPFVPKVSGFINYFSPNGFAFLCICFTAPVIVHLSQKKKNLQAFLLFLIILLTLLFEGRRAGFVLVLLSGILSFYVNAFKIRHVLGGSFVLVLLFYAFQISFLEDILFSASPRVHELLYDSENIQVVDRSLLTRRLMVEKAILIYNDHPVTGVGLNNFGNFEVEFLGDFEGGHYVANKSGMNYKSAHNSYASILGEGGLLMFIPFTVLILYNLYHFIRNFNKRSAVINAYYWAFCCACIHMYFVSAILNVYTWFLIGIVTAQSTIRRIV